MGVVAQTPQVVTLEVGDQWQIRVSVADDDGTPGPTAPTVAVTDPAGGATAPTALIQSDGTWRAYVTTATTGRWTARVTATGYGACDFAAYATALVTAAFMPTLASVKTYLGTTSFTDAEIQDALDAESAAQRRVCRVVADYPPDLAQALKRRVARNLALRVLPLAVLRGDSEGGDSTVLPSRDPEVRRLESSWRKVVLG